MIAVAALVVFGPAKLPEMGRSVGKAFREFKQATESITQEVTRAATEQISTTANSPPPLPAPTPSAPPDDTQKT